MRANRVSFPGIAHSYLGTRLGPILLMGFVPRLLPSLSPLAVEATIQQVIIIVVGVVVSLQVINNMQYTQLLFFCTQEIIFTGKNAYPDRIQET